MAGWQDKLQFLQQDESTYSVGLRSTEQGASFLGMDYLDRRTKIDKQAEVVQYLQKLTSDQRATNVDIARDLNIYLDGIDAEVLAMIKSNKAIDIIEPRYGSGDSGEIMYRYHTKFDIHNVNELLGVIDRRHGGVCMSDIRNCYKNVEDDVARLIVGGEVIAVTNKQSEGGGHDTILFPRRDPFLVELSGHVTSQPGSDKLRTNVDVRREIRRGDAIRIGEGDNVEWFRVDCAILNSSGKQPERGTAPNTVSSLKERSTRQNEAKAKPFGRNVIPLDSDVISRVEWTGSAVKHGTTNDIRQLWTDTAEKIGFFRTSAADGQLTQELIRLKLINREGAELGANSQFAKRKLLQKKEKKPRAKRVSNGTQKPSANSRLGQLIGAFKKD
jgi:hypothetical protein